MRRHFRAACIIFCIIANMMAALQVAATNTPQPDNQASANAGRALFAGTIRFQNGGPPCVACHSISGMPFPNGGSLGPDLTGASTLLGSEGIRLALQTLFFPTMNPIFSERALTPQEQSQLQAFLVQAGKGVPPQSITPLIASVAVAVFLVLLGLAAIIWRGRLKSLRRELVSHSGSKGGLAT